MHPNAFLKTLWRKEVLDQVFVAMSFEERFRSRFDNILCPAIEGKKFGDLALSAYRVDNSRTGDSILSDIVNNIAHSRLVLADLSVIDEGRYQETPIRNGNVRQQSHHCGHLWLNNYWQLPAHKSYSQKPTTHHAQH
jgi:hypothetical protein